MKQDKDSALDMLLDAISNVFGSIVLICILLIVNSTDTSIKQINTIEDSLISEKIKYYQSAIEKIKKENDEIEKFIEQARNKTSMPVAQELNKLNKELKQKNIELNNKIKELKNKNIVEIKPVDTSILQSSIDKTSKQQNEIDKLIEEYRKFSEILLDKKENCPKITSAPPLKRKSKLRYIWVIVKNGLVRPLTPDNIKNIKQGSNTYYVIPDDENFFSVQDNKFRTILKRYNKNKYYISYLVDDDNLSHQTLRNAIAISSDEGFQYYWRPISSYLSKFSTRGKKPDGTY